MYMLSAQTVQFEAIFFSFPDPDHGPTTSGAHG
jgi:hypothetical protein